MSCEDARGIVPRYLDEELTEEQAAPLRAHLLSCSGCRNAVQDAKSLSAWFVPAPAVPVPSGFAARVARRALTGDRGTLVPVPAAAVRDTSHPGPDRERAPVVQADGLALAPSPAAEERLRSFVVAAVAAAALVLLALSIALRQFDRPAGSSLHADDTTLEQSLEALDAMNAEPAPRAKPEEGER